MNGTPFAVTTLSLPRIISVTVTDDTIAVDLEDGRSIAVPIGWYPRLAHGTPTEGATMQISGAGYGIHWPELDEDIGIEPDIRFEARYEVALAVAVPVPCNQMIAIVSPPRPARPVDARAESLLRDV